MLFLFSSILRLDVSDFMPNPFDWSQDLNNIHHAHINDISPIHQSVLHLMGHWMEIFPEDFKNHSEVKVGTCVCITIILCFWQFFFSRYYSKDMVLILPFAFLFFFFFLQDAVTDVIHRLKKFRGVYTPHLHKLQSLLKEIQVRHITLHVQLSEHTQTQTIS